MAETNEEMTEETTDWRGLAVGLYERLTGRGAEISYTFEDMEVQVPSGTGDDGEHTEWYIGGTIRITTRERE